MIVPLGGESIELLVERAAYLPSRRLLLVADAHFGKAVSFRAQGIPVPRGTTSANLAALDVVLARHNIEEIIFLGDFFHAKAAHARSTQAALRSWRGSHAQLRLTLVRGNHDAHAGRPHANLGIDVVDEPYRSDGLAFCQHPQIVAGHYALASHLHPVYRLITPTDALRLPCFVFGKKMRFYLHLVPLPEACKSSADPANAFLL